MKGLLSGNPAHSQKLGIWGLRLFQTLLLASPAIAMAPQPAQAADGDPTHQGRARSSTVVVVAQRLGPNRGGVSPAE